MQVIRELCYAWFRNWGRCNEDHSSQEIDRWWARETPRNSKWSHYFMWLFLRYLFMRFVICVFQVFSDPVWIVCDLEVGYDLGVYLFSSSGILDKRLSNFTTTPQSSGRILVVRRCTLYDLSVLAVFLIRHLYSRECLFTCHIFIYAP